MREFLYPILPIFGVPAYLGTVPSSIQEAESWWEKAQRHGVGFVFFILFLLLMGYSIWREKKTEKERVARETKAETERINRENTANAERLAMQAEIRDLNQKQLDLQKEHAARLENLIKDGNTATNNQAMEIKNLARKMRCGSTSPE